MRLGEVKREGLRPEVQALRALAVLAVVIFHLWPNRLTGGYVGVDVFFVISGFLITSHLIRELFTTNRIQLARFYARRIRRLLPAAFLVLGVTLVGIFVFAPEADLSLMLRDVYASALYAVNWVLAASSVDYFAAEDAISPLQHYWSLAVEEQFYLLWPLLLLAAWISRRKSVVAATLVIVFVGCLAYSVWGAYSFRDFAYFATPAHGWEFAAGGLLALIAPRPPERESRWLPLLSWAGWAAIAVSAVVFTAASPFPGWIALLPVAGTIAVIAAGMPSARWAPSAIAGWRPVQAVGDVSYSLYLWHFPLIVLIPFAIDRDLNALEKVVVFAVCIVLAWLTKRFVEDPARTVPRMQRNLPTYLTAAVATVVLVTSSAVPSLALGRSYVDAAQHVLTTVTDVLEAGPEEVDNPLVTQCLGALATITPDECPGSHQPTAGYGPPFASLDNYDTWTERVTSSDPYFVPTCETVGTAISQCVYSTGDPDAFTVAIVGDSHAGQWLPALLILGKEHGWDIIRYRESGCRLALDVYDSQTANGISCLAWKKEIVPFIARSDRIDLVTTSASVNSIYLLKSDPPTVDEFAQGFLRVWEPWLDAGKRVLVMSDGPSYGESVPACVEREITEAAPCAKPRDDVTFEDPLVHASKLIDDPHFTSFDVIPILCDQDVCNPVVGGLITAKDGGHIAATFMVTMTPILAPRLEELVPEAFRPR